MDEYKMALEAAGAIVHAFQSFGSYQGDWWAFVSLPDGRRGWAQGQFGSCEQCDAFTQGGSRLEYLARVLKNARAR